jgi:hypothetical protein
LLRAQVVEVIRKIEDSSGLPEVRSMKQNIGYAEHINANY